MSNILGYLLSTYHKQTMQSIACDIVFSVIKIRLRYADIYSFILEKIRKLTLSLFNDKKFCNFIIF